MKTLTEKSKKRGQSSDLIRLPYFDWDKTKYFYYIAKIGSFLEAGRFLNVSQSALSRKIAALENHLNAQLFYRQSRGVELTPVGEQLYCIVEKTFLEMKEFAHNITINNKSADRVIRVVSTDSIASFILADVLFEYSLSHPGVRFELVGEKYQVDPLVSNFDIAIRPKDNDSKNVIQHEVFTFVKKLYASQDYIEKFGRPETIDDLKNHRLICVDTLSPQNYPYSDVHWILKLGQPKGRLHKPYFAANQLYIMARAAVAGMGIIASYESMSIISEESRLVNVLPDVTHKEDPLYLTYPEYLDKDDVVKSVINFLLQRLKTHK